MDPVSRSRVLTCGSVASAPGDLVFEPTVFGSTRGLEPQAEYFQPDEFRKLLDTCYVSHTCERGRDDEHRADRLQAFLLFARWTGLAMIDVVCYRRDWL